MTGRPGGRSQRCASCHGGGKGPGSPVPWDGDGEDTGAEISASPLLASCLPTESLSLSNGNLGLGWVKAP